MASTETDFAGARIAADAGVALARRERAEAAQFDAAALGKLIGDGIEDGADDAFDLALRKVGKIGAQFLHQFRTDHGVPASRFGTGPELPHTGTA